MATQQRTNFEAKRDTLASVLSGAETVSEIQNIAKELVLLAVRLQQAEDSETADSRRLPYPPSKSS